MATRLLENSLSTQHMPPSHSAMHTLIHSIFYKYRKHVDINCLSMSL